MEAGPAALFTVHELTIAPEPALADGLDRIDVGNLDHVDAALAGHEQALTAMFDELQPEAMGWQGAIDAASGSLDSDLAEAPEQLPQDLLDNRGPTQDAIDGAESSFMPDAYEETAPWMQPEFWQTPPVEEPTTGE